MTEKIYVRLTGEGFPEVGNEYHYLSKHGATRGSIHAMTRKDYGDYTGEFQVRGDDGKVKFWVRSPEENEDYFGGEIVPNARPEVGETFRYRAYGEEGTAVLEKDDGTALPFYGRKVDGTVGDTFGDTAWFYEREILSWIPKEPLADWEKALLEPDLSQYTKGRYVRIVDASNYSNIDDGTVVELSGSTNLKSRGHRANIGVLYRVGSADRSPVEIAFHPSEVEIVTEDVVDNRNDLKYKVGDRVSIVALDGVVGNGKNGTVTEVRMPDRMYAYAVEVDGHEEVAYLASELADEVEPTPEPVHTLVGKTVFIRHEYNYGRVGTVTSVNTYVQVEIEGLGWSFLESEVEELIPADELDAPDLIRATFREAMIARGLEEGHSRWLIKQNVQAALDRVSAHLQEVHDTGFAEGRAESRAKGHEVMAQIKNIRKDLGQINHELHNGL